MNNVQEITLSGTLSGDMRGWVINPLISSGLDKNKLSSFHIVSLEPNAIRGNHYHTSSNEWLIIFGGDAVLKFGLFNKDDITTINVVGERPSMFFIPSKYAHAILNTSSHTIYLLAFRDSETEDTIRCESLFE